MTYKSPHHIFTIVVPAPTSFDHSGWEISYESKNGDHAMVTFVIYDFAETYRAGIAETAGSPAELDILAHAPAASRKHQAVAQDDYLGLIRKVGDEAWKKSLKNEVQSFFATMTLGK
jgi:hypothetical protein